VSDAFIWPDDGRFDDRGRALFCVRRGCEEPVTQPASGVRLYCSGACKQFARNERQSKRRPSASRTIEELKTEAGPGLCIICGEPVRQTPKQKPARIHRGDCLRTYKSIHKSETRTDIGRAAP
jgi:hypothetical protein